MTHSCRYTKASYRVFSGASPGNQGFTLIELLIVIFILAIVMVFVLAMFWIAMAMLHPHG